MDATLQQFIRKRARERGLSLAALCRQAGVSRQTLYEAWDCGQRLPSLNTIVALATPLDVHPLRLLQLVFAEAPLPAGIRRARGVDRSAFIDDVSFPDGARVVAGSDFIKTWRIENAGAEPWVGRKLLCQDSELAPPLADGRGIDATLRPDGRELAIPLMLPGEQVELSMGFTVSPHPCTVLSYWKMVDADDTLCFPDATGIWVKVQVVAPVACAGGTLRDDLRWLDAERNDGVATTPAES